MDNRTNNYLNGGTGMGLWAKIYNTTGKQDYIWYVWDRVRKVLTIQRTTNDCDQKTDRQYND